MAHQEKETIEWIPVTPETLPEIDEPVLWRWPSGNYGWFEIDKDGAPWKPDCAPTHFARIKGPGEGEGHVIS